jgi:SAM-dependent methyltransferase
MRVEDFELLYELESTYWWFVAMRRITNTLLRVELQKPDIRVLDAGCGTGFNVKYYGAIESRRVFGLDIADAAMDCIKRKGIDTAAQASIAAIPFLSQTFDIVFSLEVVTQIPRELHDTALQEMYRVLKPGGSLFLRVPAFMWLWSSHDEVLQVRYRYTRQEIEAKLAGLGYHVEWISYANGFLFPIILLRRFLKHLGIGGGSDVRPLPRGLGWLDRTFRWVLESEAGWFRLGRRLPFGLSLICHAKKMQES